MAIIIILNGKITTLAYNHPSAAYTQRAIGVIFNETAMPYLGIQSDKEFS
jgi:hypothetical protein